MSHRSKRQNQTTNSLLSQLSSKQRQESIQNSQRGIGFHETAQQAIHHLHQNGQSEYSSQEILNDAIDNNRIQFLTQLMKQADPLFRTVLLKRHQQIINYISLNLKSPSCITLLGNLCIIYQQYISFSMHFHLLPQICQNTIQMKSNLQALAIYLWTIMNMTRQPSLLIREQIESLIECLYVVGVKIGIGKEREVSEIDEKVRQYTVIILNNISSEIQFPDQFVSFILGVKQKGIFRITLALCVIKQVQHHCKYSENLELRMQILNYFVSFYQQFGFDDIKDFNVPGYYELINILICKSKIQLSEHIATNLSNVHLCKYPYSNHHYLSVIQHILSNLDPETNKVLIDTLIEQGIFYEIISDLEDKQIKISYKCFKIISVLIKIVMKDLGDNLYIEKFMDFGITGSIESFIDGLPREDRIIEEAEDLLEFMDGCTTMRR